MWPALTGPNIAAGSGIGALVAPPGGAFAMTVGSYFQFVIEQLGSGTPGLDLSWALVGQIGA